jgi:hypothetical protein
MARTNDVARSVTDTKRYDMLIEQLHFVEPNNLRVAEVTVRDVEAKARCIGLQIRVLNANTSREIDAAFGTFERERLDALFVGRAFVHEVKLVRMGTQIPINSL